MKCLSDAKLQFFVIHFEGIALRKWWKDVWVLPKHSLIHSLATLWDERKVQQLHHDSERTMAMLTLHKRIKDLKNFFGNLLNGFTFIWRKKFFGWICEDRTSRFLSKEFQEYIEISTIRSCVGFSREPQLPCQFLG